MTDPTSGRAWFDGVVAENPLESVDLRAQPDALERGGFWVVVGEFDGPLRAWRFRDVRHGTSATPAVPVRRPWRGPPRGAWSSTLDEAAYVARVAAVRAAIRAGDVYQVNLCRVLSAPLGHDDGEPDALALARRLAAGNPAPYAGGIHVPAGSGCDPVWVVTASPELFLRVHDGVVASGPIKGTAPTADGLTDKDRAENVMIADMVRNDLSRVCRPGTVEVTSLLEVEHHPGLVHLVTTVEGRLDPGVGWGDLLRAAFPPASVSGAPRSSALRLIGDLEPTARGPYCGAVGWVDADTGEGRLAVGIRTFWWTGDGGGHLHFGTGAGITWDSDPQREWDETELKAHRLIGLASDGSGGPDGSEVAWSASAAPGATVG